jgi:hypothetical protein
MAVTIVQTRQNHLSPHILFRTSKGTPDLLIISYSDDLTLPNSQGLGPRFGFIDGIDLGIDQQQVDTFTLLTGSDQNEQSNETKSLVMRDHWRSEQV